MTDYPDSEHLGNQDFYRRLRARIVAWSESREGSSHRWTEILLLAPDLFYLLIRLSADPDVPVGEKAKLAVAVAYFVKPMDLLPELILGPVGFLDDIVLAAYALNSLINRTDPEIVTRHWTGSRDLLVTIQEILNKADRIMGSGLARKIRIHFLGRRK
ncbi:MAG TPA: DUF1232 domain-containing protein [bacterium]|nr:DUF1232 domain-containing protein [bacterium]